MHHKRFLPHTWGNYHETDHRIPVTQNAKAKKNDKTERTTRENSSVLVVDLEHKDSGCSRATDKGIAMASKRPIPPL